MTTAAETRQARTGREEDRPADDLPRAEKSHHKFTRLFWLIPALGLAYLVFLLYQDWSAEGHVIEIAFPAAPGVQPNKTKLQYRGIEVGTVTDARVEGDEGIVVRVVLDADSQDLIAREGSEFWVVQPEIGIQGIQGLRAIVAGTYLEARPGDGPPARRFVGLGSPPVVTLDDPGLGVVLLTDRIGSAVKGSPVLYRRVHIGEVTHIELSDDARAVEIYLHIEPRYAKLVRRDSVFWDAGHVELDLGILGAQINVPALQRLISGGIGMATPDPPGEPAAPGTAYVLQPEVKEEWMQWAPRIDLRGPAAAATEVGHAR